LRRVSVEAAAEEQTATAKGAAPGGKLTRCDSEAVRQARCVREREYVEANPSAVVGRSEESAGLGRRGELGGPDQPP
jgi:hypothetical protein